MIDVRQQLSDDSAAVVMLCSRLGLRDNESRVSPLTLKEWNSLARKIHDSELGRPSALLGMSSTLLAARLETADTEAERIGALLDRGGAIALEMEHLATSGIWCATRVDESYPTRIKNTLKHQAPPVLFGAGDVSIMEQPSVAIVGSRNIEDGAADFARRLGAICRHSSVAVVSGGARGTDRIAMQGALDDGGHAVGVLADSLSKTIRQSDVRTFVANGQLVLFTAFLPDSGFSVGAAMGRNKIIYGAADFSVVVSSELAKGGTWAGAVEALTAKWCPMFVRTSERTGLGNQELIRKGAKPISDSDVSQIDDVIEWMNDRSAPQPQQEVLSFA